MLPSRKLAAPCRALFNLVLLLLVFGRPAMSQTLVATVHVGTTPIAVRTNSTTNKAYVVNQGSNNVTVIDGTNYSTTTVAVGLGPHAVEINSAANQVYVADEDSASMSVIDGVTNAVTTVNVGGHPRALALNPATNKIYIANYYGNTVTVVDASSYTTTNIAVGSNPAALAIDSATNKVYVVNYTSSNVTVIDGATNSTSNVVVGNYPIALALDSQSNKIYVANSGSNNATVIDGATLSTTNVATGQSPSAIAVNPLTNKIYIANNQSGTVTILDGATLATTTVAVAGLPSAVAVDTTANNIYVTNFVWDGQLSIIAGGTNSTSSLEVGAFPAALDVNPVSGTVYVANSGSNTVSIVAAAISSNPLRFLPLTPCRVVDTRWANGSLGGPTLAASTPRSFPIPASNCGVPASAAAYSLNVTVVPQQYLGFLTVWPTGQAEPAISTMNSWDGRTKANAAIVPAGAGGAVSVFASNPADAVLDINGYFVPTTNPSALAFYPVQPCRISDTRWSPGQLGGPFIRGNASPRSLPILKASACDIPSSAQAYALNFTAIPRTPALWVFSAWPAGLNQPNISTLNAPTGTVVANAAVVPAGSNGGIDVWASNDTDLVVDIYGYFAPAGQNGLSLYSSAPCRAFDTRKTLGMFSGKIAANIVGSSCGIPSAAEAFVLNATVVPSGPLWMLTLWPDGQPQPTASTLNAWDATATSNLAIVPTTNGWVDAYAAGSTQLILDISSYFAP